jgi:putative tryptophan/tyrosine transport system substrate-binding protein
MQFDRIRRREFITLLGGAAAAWPRATYAQQRALPAFGFLELRSPDAMTDRLRALRQGLAEIGFVEGDTVTIVYRWAENNIDRVPELLADLVRRQVDVMLAGGNMSVVLAAKAATTNIPIVCIVPEDPVRLGLVTSLARPGGNLTGINFFNIELVAKQLELLHELVPRAARIAIFVNPASVSNTEAIERDAPSAAGAMGLQIQFFRASSSREVDAAFATFTREPPDALFVGNDGFFNSRRVQFVH